MGAPHVQNAEISYGFFRSGFRYVRRHYPGRSGSNFASNYMEVANWLRRSSTLICISCLLGRRVLRTNVFWSHTTFRAFACDSTWTQYFVYTTAHALSTNVADFTVVCTGNDLKRSCLCRFNSFIPSLYSLPYCTALLLIWRFNLLNPTGHLMHQQFNIQQLYVLPTLYLCVLYLSENKQRLVPLTA